MTREEKKVIWAAALGAAFEWYDFCLMGFMAHYIAQHFFSPLPEDTAFIFALFSFACGFIVRPLGGIIFGSLGDLLGRKYSFLLTILLMSTATALIGLLPGYQTLGIAAPVLLILLRLVQGLALGGEYGGAVSYVAEYAPAHRRGAYTSWIQITVSLGVMLSLALILIIRIGLGEQQFTAWGWRLLFLFSLFFLGISLWIRLQLNESPIFQKMKAQGSLSKAPIKEAFAQWQNLKKMAVVLFGLTAGQGVVSTSQFYMLLFLTQTLKVDQTQANSLYILSLLLTLPLFILSGYASDKIGRKPIILTGCFLAAISYFPLFKALAFYAADPHAINYPMVLLIFCVLIAYAALAYGPMAALMTELFPAHIRYTCMGLPYHLGNGWFGGFLPAIAFTLASASGNIYFGLWYAVIVTLSSAVIGLFLIHAPEISKNT